MMSGARQLLRIKSQRRVREKEKIIMANAAANLIRIRNIDIPGNTGTYELTSANLGFNPSEDYDNLQLAVSLGTAGSQFQVEVKLAGCDFWIKPNGGGWELDLNDDPIKLNCGADVFLCGPNFGSSLIFEAVKITFTGNTAACKLYAGFSKNNPLA
jgi:hypothetical protein